MSRWEGVIHSRPCAISLDGEIARSEKLGLAPKVLQNPERVLETPPPAKILQKQFAQNIFMQFWGSITAKLRYCQDIPSPRIILRNGGCRDLRLFHVELREIYLTPGR